VIGGSLGARTLNDALSNAIEAISKNNIQVIWQCGKGYYQALVKSNLDLPKHIKLLPFISRMDAAYAGADVVVSRAGALSVSELCLIGKATILVPSPNVAEDHQTKNAMALVANNAALLVKDRDAVKSLLKTIFDLVTDKEQINKLSENIKKLAKPNATKEIIDACETIINNDEE
jgi:UDP-N-acetylglucosamine--N-acetylmuramyl-(pentapeptide) pyrophosphoryl-undecaprenol N-acetylglucosamine transferase